MLFLPVDSSSSAGDEMLHFTGKVCSWEWARTVVSLLELGLGGEDGHCDWFCTDVGRIKKYVVLYKLG